MPLILPFFTPRTLHLCFCPKDGTTGKIDGKMCICVFCVSKISTFSETETVLCFFLYVSDDHNLVVTLFLHACLHDGLIFLKNNGIYANTLNLSIYY